MKYASLITTSVNIGDEIQCLAAQRFLPRVDCFVHRERVDKVSSSEPVKLIMNHYWMHEPRHFPPAACIDPLFVSFHLRYELRNSKFVRGRVLEYFKAHEPIGCRDTGTANFLKEMGVDAYFSGCLTTTLLPNPKLKGKVISDYVLCVDAPSDVVTAVKERTDRRVISISRLQNPCFSHEERFKMAKATLFLYHNAHCVVTYALHASIPSTAFGTPVCVLNDGDYERSTRFEGLQNLFNIVDVERFIRDRDSYNLESPPQNPGKYKTIAADLINRCTEFTGFDSCLPTLESDYSPLYDLVEMLHYRDESVEKTLYYAPGRQLAQALIRRTLRTKNRFDY